MGNEPQRCYYEERFSRLEQEVAELKARMNSKRENIDNINTELSQDQNLSNSRYPLPRRKVSVSGSLVLNTAMGVLSLRSKEIYR